MPDQDLAASYRQFLSFVSAFHGDPVRDGEDSDSDPHLPSAFEARVDDVVFSVGYDPLAAEPCLFVYCVLGVLPEDAEGEALLRLLERNVSLGRMHNASYCVDGRTRELAYYQRLALTADARDVKLQLAGVAGQVLDWRHTGFASRGAGNAAMPAAFTPFA